MNNRLPRHISIIPTELRGSRESCVQDPFNFVVCREKLYAHYEDVHR